MSVLVCTVSVPDRFRVGSRLLRWGTPIRKGTTIPDFVWPLEINGSVLAEIDGGHGTLCRPRLLPWWSLVPVSQVLNLNALTLICRYRRTD